MLNIELELMPLGIGADAMLFMAVLDGDNADDDTSDFVTCSLSIAFKDFVGIKRQTWQWVTGERVFLLKLFSFLAVRRHDSVVVVRKFRQTTNYSREIDCKQKS